MPESTSLPLNDRDTPTTQVDAVVVGAGVAGLWMLHELRANGLSTLVLEAGSDVGGTWFWNRYPGARTDSEAWYYFAFFPQPDPDEWVWRDRYPTQQECLRYLQHVADRLGLRRDIRFDTRVRGAVYDEGANTWTVETEAGEQIACTYLITATGVLSFPYVPPFPGVDDFQGEWYMTARWPQHDVDFAGKHVAIIGAGATAVQAIPQIAQTAGHLTVFQRTPNYVIPARNHPLDEAHQKAIAADRAQTYTKAHSHFFGMPFAPAGRMAADVTPEEHERIMEAAWESGGFRFLFETFDDIWIDETSNQLAADFIRKKIRAIVNDRETAELLCPKDYPLAGKRPPLGHRYYETYNRENVSLVDVRENPIVRITPDGLHTAGERYEFDMIVCATGFDVATGALTDLDIRGREGQVLAEKWAAGPQTYLGLGVEGFPNMFMICGPQTPFANIPVVVENNVGWITRAIAYLREHGYEHMEPTREACEAWAEHLDVLLNATVLPRGEQANTWFLGANIPGKAHVVLFHFGGSGAYFDQCREIAENGFTGFTTESVSRAAS
jgi:cation diffusion facilitator CzcD-associated flavoprotein CzcO